MFLLETEALNKRLGACSVVAVVASVLPLLLPLPSIPIYLQ